MCSSGVPPRILTSSPAEGVAATGSTRTASKQHSPRPSLNLSAQPSRGCSGGGVRDRVRKDTTHQSPPTVSTTSHAPAPIKPEPHGTPFPTIQTRPANTRAHDPASSVPEAHAHTLCGAHASHRIAALAAPPSYRDVTIPPACPAPRAAMRPRSIARPYPQSGAVPMPAHAPLRGTPRQPHQPRQPCQPRQPIVARARAARVPTQRHSPSSEGTPRRLSAASLPPPCLASRRLRTSLTCAARSPRLASTDSRGPRRRYPA